MKVALHEGESIAPTNSSPTHIDNNILPGATVLVLPLIFVLTVLSCRYYRLLQLKNKVAELERLWHHSAEEQWFK